MIHALPAPVRDSTHVRVISFTEHLPSSGYVIRFRLGSLDGDGAFQADPLIPEVRRQIDKPMADRVRANAAEAGAPLIEGVQEWRHADVRAVLDAEGWAP